MAILLGELGRLIMDRIHGTRDIMPTSQSGAPADPRPTARPHLAPRFLLPATRGG